LKSLSTALSFVTSSLVLITVDGTSHVSMAFRAATVVLWCVAFFVFGALVGGYLFPTSDPVVIIEADGVVG
jgi:hypothetical protein